MREIKALTFDTFGTVVDWRTSNYDLKNARSHGIGTAFVARPTEYGPGQSKDLKAESDWDVVAKNFGELARNLGA